MKKIVYALFLFASSCALWGADKIVFIACGEASALFSGGVNGAKAAAKLMGGKHSAEIEIKYLSLKADQAALAGALSKAYVEGAKGAVVFTNEPLSGAELSKTAQDLSAKGFPLCVAGAELEGAKIFSHVGTDSKKALSMLNSALDSMGNTGKLPLFCVGKAGEKADVLREPEVNAFEKSRTVLKKVETVFYSAYAAENSVEIGRMDAHGLVLLNASLLADMLPLPKDPDRRFALCLGGAPYVAFYLDNASIDICMMDDYYGFGYCLVRDICDFVYGAVVPASQRTLLSPLLFRKSDAKAFSKLWKDWM